MSSKKKVLEKSLSAIKEEKFEIFKPKSSETTTIQIPTDTNMKNV